MLTPTYPSLQSSAREKVLFEVSRGSFSGGQTHRHDVDDEGDDDQYVDGVHWICFKGEDVCRKLITRKCTLSRYRVCLTSVLSKWTEICSGNLRRWRGWHFSSGC